MGKLTVIFFTHRSYPHKIFYQKIVRITAQIIRIPMMMTRVR